MRLAIFGGTFDPVHEAHLAIARAAADGFALDRVLFVPAAHPPHKRGATHASFADRLSMIELAVRGDARFEASRLEEFTACSYSIDTIERVRALLAPEDELFFLIGADAFAEIRTWKRWEDVARAVHFLVATRPGASYDVPSGVTADRVDAVRLPVSSSDARRALAAGERPASLPPAVLEYALAHRLYRPVP
ncbi:MAG: nicotinate (nicotinamide) nucleotide adenylyltransferase [Acidobacteria bacterium]|nr:nicotinate (nicotinamide) nucleotide adenylyltransferase [Acidobacteriota bacterium]